jgi:hypothetical protein
MVGQPAAQMEALKRKTYIGGHVAIHAEQLAHGSLKNMVLNELVSALALIQSIGSAALMIWGLSVRSAS